MAEPVPPPTSLPPGPEPRPLATGVAGLPRPADPAAVDLTVAQLRRAALSAAVARVAAVVVVVGGLAVGLLVLDHVARRPAGPRLLDWAAVAGPMVLGVGLAAGLWVLADLLARYAEVLIYLERLAGPPAGAADGEADLPDLYNRLQAAAAGRRWAEAVDLGQRLLARHGSSAEAAIVRDKLPTLQANADIARRQDLEATIRQRVRDGQYAEALRLARQVISQYPDSPQARALGPQVPRLEQLAAGGVAEPPPTGT